VTDSNDGFEFDGFLLSDNLVEQFSAFRFNDSLVKVKQRRSFDRNFVGDWIGFWLTAIN